MNEVNKEIRKMVTEKITNPYRSGIKPRLLFDLLTDGPVSNRDIIEKYKIFDKIHRVKEVVSLLTMMDGLRIKPNLPADLDNPDTIWTMTVDDSCILRLNRKASEVEKKPEEYKGKFPGYIPPEEYPFIKGSVEDGENVYIVGPTGSGKTALARNLATDLGCHFIRQNFNGETMIDNLIGAMEITKVDGVAVTSFHDGELTKAVRLAAKGERVIYLSDEVTAGKPEVLFQFHRILEIEKDGTRTMEVNGEVIRTKKGCLSIIAASNSFRPDETGMFQGTNAMNAAFLNRWGGGVYFLDYAPNEDEILESSGVEKRIAKALHQMAKGIRAKSKEEGLDAICSTRQLIAIGRKASKWGCLKSLQYVYLNTLTSDERTRVVDPVIRGMLWPK